MKVLIAYDGSEHAEAALQDLHRAGLHDVDALVLSVAELWLPKPGMLEKRLEELVGPAIRQHVENATQRGREMAERAARLLREHFPNWQVEFEGMTGSAVEAIMRKTESWNADLVVVGPHGRTGALQLLPGSVSLGVITHVQCSARVARKPQHERDGNATRLVIAVDGSPDTKAILDHVRSRDWPAGTQAQVVTVVDTRLLPLVIPGLPIGPTSTEWAREVAGKAVDQLREVGLTAYDCIECGDPKAILLSSAENWEADCVFLGSRGLSRLPWQRLGSVSSAVALRAHCSVEIVRVPQESTSQTERRS